MIPHQWVVLVTYEVSDIEIEAFKAGFGMHLDDRRRLGIAGPGCRVCEQIYDAITREGPCPGKPPAS